VGEREVALEQRAHVGGPWIIDGDLDTGRHDSSTRRVPSSAGRSGLQA
jgi:hypothetical protein